MRQALGKGLDALISQNEEGGKQEIPAQGSVVQKIAISSIKANHLQPRKRFNEESIKELADSIKEHGLAQPILVSKNAAGPGYELIAGERRLRAAQVAGLVEIDCIVKPAMPNLERLAIALIENLQREDLNAIEEALGYRKLAQDFNLTQAQIAQSVGKSRVAVANCLRLLELEPEMQQAIEEGKITEGHGRALLMVDNPAKRQKLFHILISRSLSVRQAEETARGLNEGLDVKKVIEKSAEIKHVESELQHALGTKVELRVQKNNQGLVMVHYYSLEDLDRIIIILKNANK